MAKLIYVANVSLDGYVEDTDGRFDWTQPSDEVFAHITELVRPIGTHLYGRRMYETMAAWEFDPSLAAQSEMATEFADLWKTAEKIVYSTSVSAVSTAGTHLERRFDPGMVRARKASAATDLMIAGSTLAAQAFDAALVDEYHLFMYPVLLGGGKPAFSGSGFIQLELLEEHRFEDGAVHLGYRVRN
jgi:dihydrofolate reductase